MFNAVWLNVFTTNLLFSKLVQIKKKILKNTIEWLYLVVFTFKKVIYVSFKLDKMHS